MKLTERKITTTLRRHGYKLTPQRQAVIDTIVASQDLLTPARIYEKVSCEHPDIGLVTVYRTLELLSRLGLICELHHGNNCPSYTASNPEHHHHLICSGCGKVVDFTGHDLVSLGNRLARESGFKIQNHVLEFIGVCSACQETK
ncbi:MAG TPA: Fur family transcriptional regulator [Dehalococcoidales bacterium]